MVYKYYDIWIHIQIVTYIFKVSCVLFYSYLPFSQIVHAPVLPHVPILRPNILHFHVHIYHLYSLVSSPSCLNPFKPSPPHDTLLLLMSCIHTDIVTCTCTFMPLFCMKKSIQYLTFSFWITSPSITISSSTLFPVRGIISFSVPYNMFWSHPSLSYTFHFVFFFFPAIKSNLCSSCILGCVTFQFAKTVDNFNNHAYQKKWPLFFLLLVSLSGLDFWMVTYSDVLFMFQ